MRRDNDPSGVQDVVARLRDERPEATAAELDAIKVGAMRRAAVGTARSGRRAVVAALAVGLMAAGAGGVIAAGGTSNGNQNAAAAQYSATGGVSASSTTVSTTTKTTKTTKTKTKTKKIYTSRRKITVHLPKYSINGKPVKGPLKYRAVVATVNGKLYKKIKYSDPKGATPMVLFNFVGYRCNSPHQSVKLVATTTTGKVQVNSRHYILCSSKK